MPAESPSNNDIREILNRATSVLTHFVLPIYKIRNRRPIQIGSGFIVRKEARHFLVSAGHVLENLRNEELVIYTRPNEIQKLGGTLQLTSRTDRSVADTFDIAVLELPRRLAPPYSAGNKAPVDFSYLQSCAEDRSGRSFAIIGYPASKSHINPIDYEVEAVTYAYRSSSASSKQYAELGLNETDHIAVPLDLKKGFNSSGKHRNFPKPQGMSGSPIWVVYEDEPDFENRVFPVVGVGTQYHRRRKILSGTDISVVAAMIEEAA